MKNYTLFFTCIVCICLYGLPVQAQHQFRHLTIQDGLSQNNITCITQDSKGFMWFGTQDGLCYFNGYTVKVFFLDSDNPNSISNNAITGIIEDHNHYLWVATDKGLNRFDRKTETFKHYFFDQNNEHSIPSNALTSVFFDKKKNLWIGTVANGLCRYDSINDNFIRYPYEVKDGSGTIAKSILSFGQTSDNNLWIGSYDGLNIYDYNTQTFTYLLANSPNVNLSANTVYGILEDNAHNVWVATNEGVNVFDLNRTTVKHYKHDENDKNSLSNNIVRAIKQDKTGRIWLATVNGLNILEHTPTSDKFTHYKNVEADPKSLSSNEIWSLFIDKQDILWVGTFSGGVNFSSTKPNDFALYTNDPQNPQSVSHNSALSLFEDSKGRLWIGTDGGGLNLFNKTTNTFESYQNNPNNDNSLVFNTVLSVTEDNNGQLWLGTWAHGVDCFNPETKTFKHYRSDVYNKKGISGDNVWTTFTDKQGNVWLGTIGAGLNRYDAKKDEFIQYWHFPDNPAQSKIGNNIIWNIYQDSQNRLWVGTNEGLALYSPEHDNFKMYVPDNSNNKSLSYGWVVYIYEDSKHRLWICTHGGGLNLFDPQTETFTVYKQKDGLPNNIVMAISEDKKGNLWLSTLNSICKFIPPQKEGEKPVFVNYDVSHGVQSKQFNLGAVNKSSDGTIYFGGKGGFNAFNPDSVKSNEYKPPVVLTDLKIFNKSVGIGPDSPLQKSINETEKLTLLYAQSVITFDFAALNFVVPEQNQYAYRLKGFDKEWNMIGNSRSATYTNLDPGTYTLEIKASNNDGVWNDNPKKLIITILPPWWMTWWFRIGVALIVIVSIVWYVRNRLETLERQKRILSEKVTERTRQLSEANNVLQEKQAEILQRNEEMRTQNETLAWQNEEIRKKNEYITASIRSAKTIQSTILPHADVIRNYMDCFVIYLPKDIVSGDFYWHTLIDNKTTFGKHFIACVDCTGHGVPGALMSMLAASILNEAVKVKRIYDPSLVLEELNKRIIEELKQDTSENHDGMDLSLCCIEQTNPYMYTITFAGAGMPLYYYRQQTKVLDRLRGSRKKIGGLQVRNDKEQFVSETITCQSGDVLYMTSDGWTDQNNKERKPLGSKKFMELIEQNGNLPIEEQKNFFLEALHEHQQTELQRDDISVIGIKLR